MKMKVHLFRVDEIQDQGATDSLENRLKRLKRTNKEDRIISVNKKNYRAEKMYLDEAKKLFYCNFVHLRADGPGKASASNETSGIGLNSDEYFSEEAAILVDYSKGYCVAEYNVHGGKAGTFGLYLSNSVFASSEAWVAAFTVVPNDEIRDKLLKASRKSGEIKSIDFAMRYTATQELKASKRSGSTGDNFRRLGGVAETIQTEHFHLSLGGGPGGVLAKKESVGFINKLLKMVKRDDEQNVDYKNRRVTTLQVGVADNPDQSAEVLNLLNGKLEKIYEIAVSQQDRRRPYQRRREALESARSKWLTKMI